MGGFVHAHDWFPSVVAENEGTTILAHPPLDVGEYLGHLPGIVLVAPVDTDQRVDDHHIGSLFVQQMPQSLYTGPVAEVHPLGRQDLDAQRGAIFRQSQTS